MKGATGEISAHISQRNWVLFMPAPNISAWKVNQEDWFPLGLKSAFWPSAAGRTHRPGCTVTGPPEWNAQIIPAATCHTACRAPRPLEACQPLSGLHANNLTHGCDNSSACWGDDMCGLKAASETSGPATVKQSVKVFEWRYTGDHTGAPRQFIWIVTQVSL